jgi:hypothetical protein
LHSPSFYYAFPFFRMLFEQVNGANLFARGANWIPPEEVDGRVTPAAVWQAVQSAVDAHMNTLRVWGGGLWPQPALTAATDALGVMLYVDAMYASQARRYAAVALGSSVLGRTLSPPSASPHALPNTGRFTPLCAARR